MTRRLLFVGFGPFPRVPVNPSGVLARRIAASPRLRRLDIEAHALVMRTAYTAIATELEPALMARPDAVLMIGVAARSKCIRVETRAVNRASRLFPDASGVLPRALALDRLGPFLRRSPVAMQVRVALRTRGVAAGSSRDAGRYLCNASYYRALGEGGPAIFLHIPKVPDPGIPRIGRRRSRRTPFECWAEAFEQAALVLLRRARLQGVGTSVVSRSIESR